MERIENFKAGEDGENVYDQARVDLTDKINYASRLDEEEDVARETYLGGTMADEDLDAIHRQREEAFGEVHEGLAQAQTEATLVNEQQYATPSEDPDAERARQEKIKQLEDDLRAQMK